MRTLVWAAAVVLLFLSIQVETTAVPQYRFGDLNGDGNLTVADVIIDLRIAVGLEQPNDPTLAWTGDVAPMPGIGRREVGDGVISIQDVIRLLRRVVGYLPDQEFRPLLEITHLPKFAPISLPEESWYICVHLNVSRVEKSWVGCALFVDDLGWFAKPYEDQVVTQADSSGNLRIPVVTGGLDDMATKYVLYLYSHETLTFPYGVIQGWGPTVLDQSVTPAELGVLAIASAQRPVPHLTWQVGQEKWLVKAPRLPVGPDNNLFQSSNVNQDEQGRLHLRIGYDKTREYPTAAELINSRSTGYGTYVFHITVPQPLHPNIVLGCFFWDNQTDDAGFFSNREWDFEFSRFGDPTRPNTRLGILPLRSGPASQFEITPQVGEFTLGATWQPGSISLHVYRGHVPYPNSQAEELGHFELNNPPTPPATWNETRVPTPGLGQIHLNLWVVGGVYQKEYAQDEVIVDDFSYSPG